MIDHTGITVSDLKRSKDFYTTVLASLSYEIRIEFEESVEYGVVSEHGRCGCPITSPSMAKCRPRYGCIERFQWIALFAQLRLALIKIKKYRLSHISCCFPLSDNGVSSLTPTS